MKPRVKIGLTDSEDEWIDNRNTNPYNLSELGTWQYLEAIFETTMETAGGHLSIEKGGFETKVTATIRLDDVRLELLESP